MKELCDGRECATQNIKKLSADESVYTHDQGKTFLGSMLEFIEIKDHYINISIEELLLYFYRGIISLFSCLNRQ